MTQSRLVALTLALLLTPTTALAGGGYQAGAARDTGPAPPRPSAQYGGSSALNACAQMCASRVQACASTAKPGESAMAVGNRCAALAQPCIASCTPPTTPGVSMPSTAGNGVAPDPDDDPSASMPDPQTAMGQLIAQWKQSDLERLGNANRQAQSLLNSLLQILCAGNAGGPGGCTTGPSAAPSLPPILPTGDKRVTDRWSKRLPPAAIGIPSGDPEIPPPPGTNGKTTGKTTTGKNGVGQPGSNAWTTPDGCYIQGEWTVTGILAPSSLLVEASLTAGFEDGQGKDLAWGSTLHIHNTGSHPAYVGYPLPINDMIAPGENRFYTLAIYRAKGDTRSTSLELTVKYWTSDKAKCEQQAVRPGYTTPEEWGPDPGSHAPQQIQ